MSAMLQSERALDALERAVVDFQQGRIGDDALLTVAMPAIRRICRGECHAMHFTEEDGDDIAQVIALLFVTVIAQKYDPSLPIYPLIKTYARHKVLNLAKRKTEVQLLGRNLPGDEMDHENGRGLEDAVTDRLYAEQGLAAGLDGAVAEFGKDRVDDQIDKATALRLIDKSLNSATVAQTEVASAVEANPKPAEVDSLQAALPSPVPKAIPLGHVVVRGEAPSLDLAKARRHARAIAENLPRIGVRLAREELSKAAAGEDVERRKGRKPFVRGTLEVSHKRLRYIRETLGMTTQEYAKVLSVDWHALISYLYGRTRVVPKIVMERAEHALDSKQRVVPKYPEMALTTLPEVVDYWLNEHVPPTLEGVRLEVQWDRIRVLAKMIGVAETTVHRWAHGKKKNLISMNRLETICEKVRESKPVLPDDFRNAINSGRGRTRRNVKKRLEARESTRI